MNNFNKQNTKKPVFVFKNRFTLVTLLIIFVAVYIFLALQTVSSGSKLSLLEKEEETLVKKNKELTSLLVESSSLTKLRNESSQLGFSKPGTTVYLNESETVAKLP